MNRIKDMWERVTTVPSEGTPGGMRFQWHVTERCDQRCEHCYQPDPIPEELALPTQFAILDQFRYVLRRRADGGRWRGHITLTGGEPFLLHDFGKLIERVAAHRAWTDYSIETHGGHIDPRLARWLALRDPLYVQVSLDGQETTHDEIRGEGSWARAVRGIQRLVQAGVRTVVAFTANRANYREFGAVADVAHRLGAVRVWADRHVPCGRGWQMETLTPEEARSFFRSLSGARRRLRQKKSRTQVGLHRALQFLVGGGPPYRCPAGDTTLAIMPDGTLYPCRRMPVAVGNVCDLPIAKLYARSKTLRALRDRNVRPAGCEECVHVQECAGGLRCLSYASTGNPFRAEQGCWLAKHAVAKRPSGARSATS
jgi:radical SAM protein with 4Fe4S-binding SPASM domain